MLSFSHGGELLHLEIDDTAFLKLRRHTQTASLHNSTLVPSQHVATVLRRLWSSVPHSELLPSVCDALSLGTHLHSLDAGMVSEFASLYLSKWLSMILSRTRTQQDVKSSTTIVILNNLGHGAEVQLHVGHVMRSKDDVTRFFAVAACDSPAALL